MSIKDGCSRRNLLSSTALRQSLSPLDRRADSKAGAPSPQVQRERTFDADRVFDGIMLIFSGLIRKCVVADNCAVLANAAFGGQFGKPTLWVVYWGLTHSHGKYMEILAATATSREAAPS